MSLGIRTRENTRCPLKTGTGQSGDIATSALALPKAIAKGTPATQKILDRQQATRQHSEGDSSIGQMAQAIRFDPKVCAKAHSSCTAVLEHKTAHSRYGGKMKSAKITLPAAVVFSGFLICTLSFGKPEYSKKEKQPCAACHAKVSADKAEMVKNLTAKGTCYKDNGHSLANCSAPKQ